MQAPCIGHWNVIMHILRYLIKASSQGLLHKDKKIPKSLGIVMLIRQDLLRTNILQDILFFLDEILFLGKVRNKM